jgi:hypothetical protein
MTEVDDPATRERAPRGHRALWATLVAVGFVAIVGLAPLVGRNPNTAVAGRLTSALVGYYRLLPGHPDTAWDDLTPAYQRYVGGTSGYRAFWQPIDRITLTDPAASPPDSVTVTIDYHYRTGGVEVERTSFGLVQQDGRWKIDRSSVLSHHTEGG